MCSFLGNSVVIAKSKDFFFWTILSTPSVNWAHSMDSPLSRVVVVVIVDVVDVVSLWMSMRKWRATLAACDSSDTW